MAKYTSISGYTRKDNKPPLPETFEEFQKSMDWHKEHYKQYSLRGFWNLESAIKYAKDHGIKVTVTIDHHTVGFKSWQCRVEDKWHLDNIESNPVKVEPTELDNEIIADSMQEACEDSDERYRE